jgi:carbon-monoxide dehydrogenase medium subunit
MQSIHYRAPVSIDEAVSLLGEDADARVFAGGTDLLVQVRSGLHRPSAWVDIKRIPELMRLEVEADEVCIGAAVTCAEIVENAEIQRRLPGVSEAIDLIGSTQVQGRATLGGNLCNASPAADSVPALIAARALCVIAGPGGERVIPTEELAAGPGESTLGRGELLVSVRIPTPPPRSGDAYLRMIPRTDLDIAVAGAGVALTFAEDGTCSAARVVIGAVAPTALLVSEAAAALVGSRVHDAALEAVAQAASAAACPINDKRGTIAYRKKVVGVLAKRAAALAASRVQES